MLRISVLNESTGTRLKLEGKLAHEWVREAEAAWTTVVGLNGSAEIVVDLFDVSFVDEPGHILLAAMRHAGDGPVASRTFSRTGRDRRKANACGSPCC